MQKTKEKYLFNLYKINHKLNKTTTKRQKTKKMNSPLSTKSSSSRRSASTHRSRSRSNSPTSSSPHQNKKKTAKKRKASNDGNNDDQPKEKKPRAKPAPLILENGIIQFHSKAAPLKNHPYFLPDDMKKLSNFSEHSVEYEGHIYPTVEHAYQAQKYKYAVPLKPELVAMFYDGTLKTPLDAKKAGGRGGMTKNGVALNVAAFNAAQMNIMRDIIQSKIDRHPDIQEILRKAREHHMQLVHFSRSDMLWGAHVEPDGSAIKRGENKLGELYLRLRLP